MSKSTFHYSEAFKMQVVDEIEHGRFGSPNEAKEAYGIGGTLTVYRWIREYGKSHLLKKVVRVEKEGEPRELKRLKDRTRRLEELVADLTMDRELERAAFDMVCEQQGIDGQAFKKNSLCPGLAGRSRGRHGGGSEHYEVVCQGENDPAELLQEPLPATTSGYRQGSRCGARQEGTPDPATARDQEIAPHSTSGSVGRWRPNWS